MSARSTPEPTSWSTVETVLCDLDGVVWLAHRPIPGSVEAIARLRSAGRRVLFVTNNSASTRAQQEAALAGIGIRAVGDVVTSAMAAARLVEPGERVLVAGGPGVVEAVAERGTEVVVNDGQVAATGFDAVVVGLHRDFDFARLSTAAAAVRSGARLIGTNSDATYPTPTGLEPGGGSILAAIATAAGVTPVVAGKPHPPMAALICAVVTVSADRVVMVGDRPDTDGSFAQRIGCRFALVRSGVTTGVELPAGIPVDLDAPDLAAVVDRIVAGADRRQ